MAVTNEDIIGWLQANPNATDADIAKAMEIAGVSPSQLANAVGISEGEVAARVAATVPYGQAILLGDTWVQPNYQVTGSGEDQQIGPIENVSVMKTKGGVNDAVPTGTQYQQYNPDGTFQQTGVTQKVDNNLSDFLLTAGTLFGLPAGIGNALGLTGAVGQAVGQGLLTTGTKLGGGESLGDALKAGLIGGGLVYGGSQLGDLINKSTYDSIAAADTAGGLTPKFGTTYDEFMANIMDSPEAQQALQDIINGKTSVASLVTPEADAVNIVGARPSTVNIGDVFATTPTLTVTGSTTKPTTQQDVINTLTTTPEVKITGERPKVTTIGDTLAAITTLPSTLTTTPTTTSTTPTTPTKETPLTTSDIIKLVSIVPAIAAVNKAVTPSTSTPTYPVVPIPESWATPTKTGVASFTPLTPIDFGTRNLLIGTQWEKFLDPNYGKVPAPVQYSQPSSLSYSDLMGILGSKQGMPPASSLSINDIISGIQNQYGQAPRSTMG